MFSRYYDCSVGVVTVIYSPLIYCIIYVVSFQIKEVVFHITVPLKRTL